MRQMLLTTLLQCCRRLFAKGGDRTQCLTSYHPLILDNSILMPKLDGTHLPQRLAQRLADLKSHKEVAARDIRALLSKEQVAEMDAAWKQQQTLRKQQRARNKQEEQELGWKSKRDIYIDAYEKALQAANNGVLQELERLQMEATKRQMRIYMSTIKAQLAAGKDLLVAKNIANKIGRAHV